MAAVLVGLQLLSHPGALFLSHQIPATIPSHPRQMHRPRRHIATVARSISRRLSIHCQCHLARQNNMRRFASMRMVGIKRLRPVLPHKRMLKSFRAKLFC
jgi:hypothetical protein